MRLRTHNKDSAWELKTRLNWSGPKLHHQCYGHHGLSWAMEPFICILSPFPSSEGVGHLFSVGLFCSSQKLSIKTSLWCSPFHFSGSHWCKEMNQRGFTQTHILSGRVPEKESHSGIYQIAAQGSRYDIVVYIWTSKRNVLDF